MGFSILYKTSSPVLNQYNQYKLYLLCQILHQHSKTFLSINSTGSETKQYNVEGQYSMSSYSVSLSSAFIGLSFGRPQRSGGSVLYRNSVSSLGLHTRETAVENVYQIEDNERDDYEDIH